VQIIQIPLKFLSEERTKKYILKLIGFLLEPTIDQALQKGIEAHKSGQFEEAGRLYKLILKTRPRHPDANHNIGVLEVDAGNVEKAISYLRVALETNPNVGQYWISYIDALIKKVT